MDSKHRFTGTIMAFLIVPFMLQAQENLPEYNSSKENDLQFRTGFEVEKSICNRFAISWNEELRLKDNFSKLDRIYSDISLSMKATRWLKLSAGYTFISIDHEGKKKNNYKNYWNLRHRLTLGATFSYRTYTNWTFSLKERVQTTFLTEDNIDKREKSNPKWVLKSKVMAQYKIRRIPLVPYISVELCNTLNAPDLTDGEYLEKIRSAIGAQYRFNKRNSINFYYRFDYNLDKKLDVKKSTGVLKSITNAKEYNNIFCVSYKYKF